MEHYMGKEWGRGGGRATRVICQNLHWKFFHNVSHENDTLSLLEHRDMNYELQYEIYSSFYDMIIFTQNASIILFDGSTSDCR